VSAIATSADVFAGFLATHRLISFFLLHPTHTLLPATFTILSTPLHHSMKTLLHYLILSSFTLQCTATIGKCFFFSSPNFINLIANLLGPLNAQIATPSALATAATLSAIDLIANLWGSPNAQITTSLALATLLADGAAS
jgi:hypothetical protein